MDKFCVLVLVYVYMLMREASLKQRILCVMRTSIFGPFQREESAHYTQANTGVRQSSAQGLHGCRGHKALDTKSLKFATWQSLKKKSLLVWESFRAHLTDPLKQALPQTNTFIAVIPSRLTSVLQPLNVCLNKPLRLYARKMDDMDD